MSKLPFTVDDEFVARRQPLRPSRATVRAVYGADPDETSRRAFKLFLIAFAGGLVAASLCYSERAHSEPIASFVATGKCNELAQIERERLAIRADPNSGFGGQLARLEVNSREFIDTLEACAWDASHPRRRSAKR